MKYHLNMRTGTPKVCKASKRKCPFGGDSQHFSSEELARKEFEKRMEALQGGYRRETHTEIEIEPGIKVDSGLANVIKAMRKAGLNTEFSCEGGAHYDLKFNPTNGYISTKGVSLEQAEKFFSSKNIKFESCVLKIGDQWPSSKRLPKGVISIAYMKEIDVIRIDFKYEDSVFLNESFS